MFFLYLTSALFLGWSLGANDAANVFGTAVGTRMVSFRKAALLCGAFVILGSVISGAGPSETIGRFGPVNASAGAFVVALAAGFTIYLMTKAGYPVSTTQAIVGGIIGWNIFTESLIDYASMTKIISTWIASPVLTAIFSILVYKMVSYSIRRLRIHMFSLDSITRAGLILVGILGSYSLGANNIANVVGVFTAISPFQDISFAGLFELTAVQQLFLIGGISIAVGVMTYSKKVIMTVGAAIFEISPVAAFAIVLAESIVLLTFTSKELESFLIRMGLPTIPLVPVSSSQAVVGGVVGIGLIKGARAIQWKLVGQIVASWAIVPILAAIICFVSLFFVQNVFQQRTYYPIRYILTPEAAREVEQTGIDMSELREVAGKEFQSPVRIKKFLKERTRLTPAEQKIVMDLAEIEEIQVTKEKIAAIRGEWITEEEKSGLEKLAGEVFPHRWLFKRALAEVLPGWQPRPGDKAHSEELSRKLSYLCLIFRVER